MGSGIALDEAEILSTVLEGILYGFSLLMFIGTMWVLVHQPRRHTPKWMMVAIVLLILSTAHMIVDIVRIDEGLVKYRNTFPGGPVAFFADISQYTYVSKNAIYLLQTLVGDGVVIYRCYVVWKSIWIIIIPSLLWCSVAVTGTGSVYSVSQATVNASNIFARGTSMWITGFFVSTLSTNLLSSGLLAYRIWIIERHAASFRTSRSTLRPVLNVIVDAALLYSVTLFVTLICFVTANNGEYIIVNMVMPIISIAFYVVMVRVALGRTNNVQFAPNISRRTSQLETTHSLRVRPLQVRISQLSSKESSAPYPSGNQAERDLSSLKDKEEYGVVYEV